MNIEMSQEDMKILENTRPATAGETESLNATEMTAVIVSVRRLRQSILHMNHLLARRNNVSAERLVLRLVINLKLLQVCFSEKFIKTIHGIVSQFLYEGFKDSHY